MYEANRCPNCGTYDSLVPIETERAGNGRLRKLAQVFRWGKDQGVEPMRRFRVHQFRCLSCASVEIVRRDFHDRHKNHKPSTGKAAPNDGRIFMASPIEEED
jgi:predicted RNA-binding Zn-ribbon protein involved in translation (DUF1610 family)